MDNEEENSLKRPVFSTHASPARQLASILLVVGVSSVLPGQVIELSQLGSTHPGFRIDGIDTGDYSGFSVSGAGDVDGDGLADLIVGAPRAQRDGNINVGEAYVVLGKRDWEAVDLAALGTGGFRIDGVALGDMSGNSASGSGDLNGDGLTDVVVGAPDSDPNGKLIAGASHVIFGTQDTSAVDLTMLTGKGFRINGETAGDKSGLSVSGAGDVNGDGLSDAIIGAVGADPGGDSDAGTSYVIFGKADDAPLDLSTLGSGGFRILGINVFDFSGVSVSGAGDVNGDGLADVVVGAPNSDPLGRTVAGEAYVVFGKTDGASVELSALGTGGFRILGAVAGDGVGLSVSAAGDVNGDGFSDLILGAPNASPGGYTDAGTSFVVFGKSDASDVDLAALTGIGFKITGFDTDDGAGLSVAGAGDVNGDGLADLLVGAPDATAGANRYAGQSYLIFGKADGNTVDLSSLGDGGIRIDGANLADQSGWSVSGAGDVNGDGLADLVIGAYFADPGGDSASGASYVIFSPSVPPPSASYRGTARSGDAPRVAIGITGDGSNDSTPDSRCWIDFVDGSGPGSNGSSLQTVELIRSDAGVSGELAQPTIANVIWHISSDREGWTAAALTLKYTEEEIAGLKEESLQLYSSESLSGPWSELSLGRSVNPAANTVGSTTTALGRYFAIRGEPITGDSWMLY